MDPDFKMKLIMLGVVLLIARLIAGHIYDPSIYRGPWYTVKIPLGWTAEKQEDEVLFKSPEQGMFGSPLAVFSIYGYQSRGALFLDMFFPEVLANLQQQNVEILSQGQIKIDNQIASWVLCRNKDPEWIIWSFYVVDDYNRLTKVQFMTKPEDFKRYRPVFEQFRDTIKIKGFL